jgi:hypothetical protein
MSIVAFVLFLIPSALLAAAWRRFIDAAGDAQTLRWRSYSGAGALSLASLATLLELIFFFSWFHNGGSPHGMSPSPGIWKFVGRIAFWMFVASVTLAFFGKGRWRILISAWVVSLCLVVPLIFALEMD